MSIFDEVCPTLALTNESCLTSYENNRPFYLWCLGLCTQCVCNACVHEVINALARGARAQANANACAPRVETRANAHVVPLM